MGPAGLALIAGALVAASAPKRVIFPPGAKPIGPYSPGIFAGEFLYVSGQGARTPDGRMPATFPEQVRQCLENIKTIVEAAGLTMEHIVYTQIYLQDTSNYDAMNPVLAQFFTRNPPARSSLGVYHMPTDTPIEINAVAVRDLARKKPIVPSGYKTVGPLAPGVQAGDRLYISGFLGRDPATGKIPEDPAAQVELALDRFASVLSAAGMSFRNLVFVNPYLTKQIPMEVMNRAYAKRVEFGSTPARATIQVAALPLGANIEFTGIAIGDLSKRRVVRPKNMTPSATASPCVFADDTLYCSAKSAFIPGPNSGIYSEDVETQVRQTMRNLLDGLEEGGLSFADVVASNVYLDNIDEFTKMNGVYGKFFGDTPPTRTTVAPLAPMDRKRGPEGRWPMVEQISVVAVR